jgi:hypothetical protein
MKSVRHNILVLSGAALVSVFIFMVKKQNTPVYQSNVFHTSMGWGYEILVNDRVFIRQESIPVLPGHQGFPLKTQAEATARLIINKMKRHQPPTVTTFEIRQICPLNKIDNGQQGKHQ